MSFEGQNPNQQYPFWSGYVLIFCYIIVEAKNE